MTEERTSKSGAGWGRYRRQAWSELDDYDRASPAVDCVLLTVAAGALRVMILRRDQPPHQGEWALPGVFANFGARYEDEVTRALKEKASVHGDWYCEQLVSWNAPDRDPRGWVITVAYLALAPVEQLKNDLAGTEGVALASVGVPASREGFDDVTLTLDDGVAVDLAFDHATLVGLAVARLRGKAWYTPVVLELMPETFTLRQLQTAFETVLGRSFNRATFRKRVIDDHQLVEPTGLTEPPTVGRRRAELYRRAGVVG